MREAIREALREELARDPRVFLIGEEIGVFGGTNKVTEGLIAEFGPDRVRDTPISESVIVGASVGAAITGMRPVAEIMFMDFVCMAMDSIVNQAAKLRYMSGGKATVPLVVRTPGGSGRSSAAQHAQSLEAWFCHVPGLMVVMPSTPYDAKGLLKASIREDNPVVFVEHKMLYNVKGPVPEGEYEIPLGIADVKRVGKDLTVIATGKMVHVALKAATLLSAEGIDVEVVDPRTLVPLDVETVCASVRKTGRALIVHEAVQRGGYGAELAATIHEHCFDALLAPVQRLGARNVPVPFAPHLEKYVTPTETGVCERVRSMLQQTTQRAPGAKLEGAQC